MTTHSDNQAVDILLDDLAQDPERPPIVWDPDALEELDNLSTDLRASQGNTVPILVSADPVTPGKYIILDGWRRFLAARTAGLDRLRALVVPVPTRIIVDVPESEEDDV